MTAIILAGGKNTRMAGEDKAFLEINGRPVIAILIDRLKALVKEIIIVTNSPQKYTKFKVHLVKDEIMDKGPLMGIYSGLKFSSSKYNFIVACDMPFINQGLIRYIMKNKNGYDIIIPKIDKKYHPLFGVYSKNCISIIERALRKDKLNVSTIFPKVKTGFISRREIERFDKPLLSLVNINTHDDLAMLKVMKGVKACQRQYFQR